MTVKKGICQLAICKLNINKQGNFLLQICLLQCHMGYHHLHTDASHGHLNNYFFLQESLY